MVNEKRFSIDNIINYFIIFLIYYVFCESILTKYFFSALPILKYSHEGIIYGMFFILFTTSLRKMKALSHDKILIFLSLYIFAAAFIINKFNLSIIILSQRTIYRYIILYFIIINLNISKENLTSYLKHIKVCSIVCLSIGLLQIILPAVINPIVSPSAFQIGNMVRDDTFFVIDGKAIFSLFERYDRYGTFLAIFIILIFSMQKKTKNDTIIFVFAIINIIYTYSRQSWIALTISIVILLILKRNYLKLISLTTIGLLSAGVIFIQNTDIGNIFFGSPLQRLLQVFNSSFIHSNLASARLRIYVDVLPKFLHEFNIYTLFGLGIGNFAMLANSMNNTLYMRYFLLFNVQHSGIYHIGDVYWVELLMEIGIIGVLIIFIYLYKAICFYYNNFKNPMADDFSKSLNLTSIGLIIVFFIINFFGPSMLITSFSFFFWLILAITSKMNMINTLSFDNKESKRI